MSVRRRRNEHCLDFGIVEDRLRVRRVAGKAETLSHATCVFILNPTRIAEVKACSDKGEKMPQKSTDFYPKMISGLAMLDVGANVRL